MTLRALNLGDFPYDSFAVMQKDHFKKLDGQDEVFRMIVECYKQRGYRKNSQMKQQGVREHRKAVTVAMEQRAARKGMTLDQYIESLDA